MYFGASAIEADGHGLEAASVRDVVRAARKSANGSHSGEATRKKRILSDLAIDEMSLVYENYQGKTWEPRNPDAKLLGVKAEPVGETSIRDVIRLARETARRAGHVVTKANEPQAGQDRGPTKAEIDAAFLERTGGLGPETPTVLDVLRAGRKVANGS